MDKIEIKALRCVGFLLLLLFSMHASAIMVVSCKDFSGVATETLDKYQHPEKVGGENSAAVPVAIAATNLNELPIIRSLIAKKIDLNSREKFDTAGFEFTPLSMAAWCGNDEAVKILIDAHADVSLPAKGTFISGTIIELKPLTLAILGSGQGGQTAKTVFNLLSKGALPLQADNSAMHVSDYVLAARFADAETITWLHEFCKTKNECPSIAQMEYEAKLYQNTSAAEELSKLLKLNAKPVENTSKNP